MKTFWLMSGNIDRIMAQRDMRSLTVAVCGQAAGETANQFRQALVIEAGTIVKMVPGSDERAPVFEERDEAGFASLKELSNQQ